MRSAVEQLRRLGARVGEGFEVAISGVSRGPNAVDWRGYEPVGATSWLESLSSSYGELDELFARVRAGPPG